MDNSGFGSSGGMDVSGDTIQGGEVSMEFSYDQPTFKDDDGKVEEIKPDNSTVFEIKSNESDKIMDIPGTAHEKLAGLADLSDEEIEISENNSDEFNAQEDFQVIQSELEVENDEKKASKKTETKTLNENEPSFEDQIIKLQAETMKLMAEKMNSGSVNKKEREELMEKLKKLLEKLEGNKSSKKEPLITGIFVILMMLTKVVDEGTKTLDNEVKESVK